MSLIKHYIQSEYLMLVEIYIFFNFSDFFFGILIDMKLFISTINKILKLKRKENYGFET